MKIGVRRISSIFIFFIFLVCCNVCWADVVQPGTKEVGLSYQIENINDYPEYVFLVRGIPNPTYEVINSSEFSFYKLSQVSMYAMKKSDYSQINLTKMNDSEINNFFKNDKRVIHSDIELSGSYGAISESNPLENALMVLKIQSINADQLNITKTKMIYYFNDGTSTIETFKDQEVIPKPENHIVSNNSIYLLIALIVIALLILLFVKKMKNK